MNNIERYIYEAIASSQHDHYSRNFDDNSQIFDGGVSVNNIFKYITKKDVIFIDLLCNQKTENEQYEEIKKLLIEWVKFDHKGSCPLS